MDHGVDMAELSGKFLMNRNTVGIILLMRRCGTVSAGDIK